ncbi:proteasome subunit beta [Aureococcus anophagefferens]|nr:proteasome subunit beta [Aureococcus anophagefferens]
MDLNSQEFYGGGLKEGEVSTGTTIMAVAYDGGVIMGADSRVSTGTYIANRVSDKVSHLHDKIFMCRSGSAADTQAVSDYVRHYLGSHAIEVGKPPLVKTAANLAKRICYTNKEQLLAGVIVAGHDDADGGSVYVIPLGGARPRPPFAFSARARRRRRRAAAGTCLKVPFAIGGSGSTYIYGHVDHTYKPNMSLAECKVFVKEAVTRAMCRDGSSGGIIRLVCINADGVEREYHTI